MNFLKPHSVLFVFAVLSGGVLLVNEPHRTLAAAVDAPTNAPIPWDQIGAKAGADYHGDGLRVVAQGDNVKLNCVFQRLEGEATPEGLWLTSTVTNQTPDRFRVVATSLGRTRAFANPTGYGVRQSSGALVGETPVKRQETAAVQDAIALTPTGTVLVDGQTVRYARPGLVEEYTVSMDGVRQDFVVLEPPLSRSGGCLDASHLTGQPPHPTLSPKGGEGEVLPSAGLGELRLELAVSGARVERTAAGAQLVLAESGRKIAYGRLRVTDAAGQELPARMEVASGILPDVEGGHPAARKETCANDAGLEFPDGLTVAGVSSVGLGSPALRQAGMPAATTLAIVVDDTAAAYPIRIDPTFSDANWISMGGLPGADDYVRAAVVDGSGNLYIGGGFTMVGDIHANYIAKWDGSSWSALGAGMNDSVRALAVSANGDLYAGGYFQWATNSDGGAVSANYIAKWNGSSWSALGDGLSYYVYALAVSGSDLYAGGDFTTAGGVSAKYIAKWNGSSWSALGAGMNNIVLTLAVVDNNLYAGGSFTTAGGVSAKYIAKWNGSSWSALGTGMDLPVHVLAVGGNGDLYAGGAFRTAGGVAAKYIAQWNGSSWSALGSGIDDWVGALAVAGNGELYVGGDFQWVTNSGGVAVSAKCIAKWDGSSWSALGAGIGDRVYALAVLGSDLYAGGNFTTAGDVAAYRVAQWNGSSWSALSALGAGMNGPVWALAVSGSDLYAGGSFWTAGGVTVNSIAQWDGSSWSALGAGISRPYLTSPVLALAVAGNGELYVGGDFRWVTNSGGVAVSAKYIAKWDGSSWSALGAGMNNQVHALAVSGSDLYVGGQFTTAGGVTANRIARWDGSSWSALGTGINGTVSALAVAGSDLYAGGNFTTAGGVTATNIARWNGSSWSALGVGMNDSVATLAVSGSDLYAGGWFTTAGGVTAKRVAKWDGSSWSALGAGMNNQVRALAVSGNGDLYAGGDFTVAGGVTAKRVAKWDGSSWSALGSGMNNIVLTLAVVDNNLYAGGSFTTAGDKVSAYVARAVLDLPPSLTPIPLQWQVQNQQLVLSWTNSDFQLQAAPEATGTYTNVPNATSPYTNPFTGPRRFFRLKAP